MQKPTGHHIVMTSMLFVVAVFFLSRPLPYLAYPALEPDHFVCVNSTPDHDKGPGC